MQQHQPFLILLLLFVLGLTACADEGPRDDVAEIKTTYAEYVKALGTGDGDKAAALTDAVSIAYYDNMLQLARTADSAEVARLDVMDRITVLGLRLNAGDRLATMDAREAIAAGVSSGMMGAEEMAALELGNVTVKGDDASAPIRMSGFPVPAKFRFHREGDEWKIDITPLFSISRMAIEQMALRRGGTGNEWLMEMLESSTGQRPGNEIWHPQQ